MTREPKTLRGLHLHLDPVSGIAGDMTVAALVDAGVPEALVSEAVAAVGVPGLSVRFETRRRGAFMGRGFVVDAPGSPSNRRRARAHAHAHSHHHDHAHDHAPGEGHGHPHPADAVADAPAATQARLVSKRSGSRSRVRPVGAHDHRDYAEIRRLLARAKLDPDARALAEEIFSLLAEVEAALHGTDVERVTFHEIGAFDSIADIVGMSAAIAWLAPASIGSSPPVVGSGTVQTAHGVVPVPAPATAALLRGIPMIADGYGELTTPTGAAFLAAVVDSFGPPPPQRVVAIGYGAGSRVLPDRANVLRAMLGQPLGTIPPSSARSSSEGDGGVLVLETNIDDMTGQMLAALFDALFEAGALDVWATAILMKKGRPGHKISALVDSGNLPSVETAFFLSSTTLGLRIQPVSRSVLARSISEVATAFGKISVKIAGLDGAAIGAMPEYEDCRRQAFRAGVPVRRVWSAALAASSHLVETPPAIVSPTKRKPRPARGAKRGKKR